MISKRMVLRFLPIEGRVSPSMDAFLLGGIEMHFMALPLGPPRVVSGDVSSETKK